MQLRLLAFALLVSGCSSGVSITNEEQPETYSPEIQLPSKQPVVSSDSSIVCDTRKVWINNCLIVETICPDKKPYIHSKCYSDSFFIWETLPDPQP